MTELMREISNDLKQLLGPDAVYDLQMYIVENIDPEDALPIVVSIDELKEKWGDDFVRFVESINLVFGVK